MRIGDCFGSSPCEIRLWQKHYAISRGKYGRTLAMTPFQENVTGFADYLQKMR